MSKKCRAYSESKLGLEPTDNRKAFYAGWDAALAQQAEPVQESVAWIQPDHLQKARIAPFLCRVEPTQRFADFVPLYLSPPQRKPQTLDDAMQQPQRKPLTKEEIDNICRQAHGGADPQEWARNFARAIERAHGIGEQP